MRRIGEIIINQQKQSGSQQSLTTQSETSLPVSQDLRGQNQMAEILTQCFQALNLYGKEPEQLAAAIPLFQMVLSEYSIDQIRPAFVKWLQTNGAFPAPADIVSLIERGGKPPLDRAVYVAISKKPADVRTKEEWGYLSDYEREQIHGR